MTVSLRFGLLIAALIFGLDQALKWIMIDIVSLERLRMIDLIPIFRLTWAENCGISLSLFSGCSPMQRWLLVALTGVLSAIIALWMTRERERIDMIALAMILGGALGNIADRIHHGYVVDFADLHFGDFRPFMIFNLADVSITSGVVLLVARALFLREKESETSQKTAVDNKVDNKADNEVDNKADNKKAIEE